MGAVRDGMDRNDIVWDKHLKEISEVGGVLYKLGNRSTKICKQLCQNICFYLKVQLSKKCY